MWKGENAGFSLFRTMCSEAFFLRVINSQDCLGEELIVLSRFPLCFLLSCQKSIKQENSALSLEVQTTRERQQGEGQESSSNGLGGTPNGTVHEESGKEDNISLAEHEKA